MTNFEILATETALKGYEYNGANLYTFHEWKKLGYSVKKGEKAFLKTQLWKHTTKTLDDGSIKNNLFLTTAVLFTLEQVEPIKEVK